MSDNERFDKFKVSLEALCVEHGVQIATGDGPIEVWSAPENTGRRGEEPIYLDAIEWRPQ